jgi:hypothetical protein
LAHNNRPVIAGKVFWSAHFTRRPLDHSPLMTCPFWIRVPQSATQIREAMSCRNSWDSVGYVSNYHQLYIYIYVIYIYVIYIYMLYIYICYIYICTYIYKQLIGIWHDIAISTLKHGQLQPTLHWDLRNQLWPSSEWLWLKI